MNTRISLMLLFTSVFSSAFAQQNEINRLSLQQSVELAKKNNYTLANSRIDQKLADKKVSEILALGLPQVNASGTFTDYLDIPAMLAPATFINAKLPSDQYAAIKFGLPYSLAGGISASQLIFDGTFFLGLKAAKEFTNLARLGVKRTETEITAGVTKMYYSVLITQANVEMLNSTISTLEKTLKDNKAYYQNGFTEKIDVDRLELAFSNTQIQRDKISDQYTLACMMLKLQLGLNIKDSLVLTDDLEKIFAGNGMISTDTKLNYDQRDDYKMMEEQIRLQSLDIKRYQVGYAPSMFASLAAQRTSYGTEIGKLGTDMTFNKSGIWFPTTIFAINLTVPIFDGFRKSSQIQQSKLTMMKYENDKKNLQNNIDNELEQAKLKFDRSKQQMEIQKKNMALAQEIYDRANVKYKNGVGSSLELTTSENEMKTAQTNYLGSVYDMLVAQIDLKKALGLLN